MDNFTNQARFEFKKVFEIYVIYLVFICCGWSINRVKHFLYGGKTVVNVVNGTFMLTTNWSGSSESKERTERLWNPIRKKVKLDICKQSGRVWFTE